ncbi:hypothetical protein M5K25_025432 [Dendrobium thyrsiflorum]|uniref:Uncharacterized protein n=1 Tax=Dendrobium thyrsiflorum TaxID=117978 RepID=A0ABD0U470_DENTH
MGFRTTEVRKTVVSEGGRKGLIRRATEVGRTIVDKGGQKDRSRQATEVGKTVVKLRRPLSGDGGRKDRSLETEVERTVVGERRRSERPLSSDGGQKDHSRRATVVIKTVVGEGGANRRLWKKVFKRRNWSTFLSTKVIFWFLMNRREGNVYRRRGTLDERSEGPLSGDRGQKDRYLAMKSAGDTGHKDHRLVIEIGWTVIDGRQRSERPLSGDGGRKDRCLASSGEGGRKEHSRRATEVGKTIVGG